MSESDDNSITKNRSALKDFLASIATIRGDLSNITAPPFVLDTKSAVELPSFWAERPSIFCAPTTANSPQQRALLVLKWFLSSLRNQQYAGRDPSTGVKKPLNAFLGELFIATWDSPEGTTEIVSEQVSHHPPVTACRVWNEQQGVYAEGFTRQEITIEYSHLSVSIKQIGHAVLSLEKWNEAYLIPLPSVRVSGLLAGHPYPELSGTYYIPSTNGYMSRIDFSGRSFLGSSDKKHSFTAILYREGEETNPLFEIAGNWDSEFRITDSATREVVETFNAATAPTTKLQTQPLDEQDEWETRKAWRAVREALNNGNMQRTADSKSIVEEGQRQMRKDEQREGKTWERLFFKDRKSDDLAQSLAAKIGENVAAEDTVGVWGFDEEAWRNRRKPYRGGLRPDNKQACEKGRNNSEQMNGTVVGSSRNRHRGSTSVSGMSQSYSETTKTTTTMTNGTVDPPLSSKIQQQDVEQSRPESGVVGMTMQEQAVVEEMLRKQYSSSGR